MEVTDLKTGRRNKTTRDLEEKLKGGQHVLYYIEKDEIIAGDYIEIMTCLTYYHNQNLDEDITFYYIGEL